MAWIRRWAAPRACARLSCISRAMRSRSARAASWHSWWRWARWRARWSAEATVVAMPACAASVSGWATASSPTMVRVPSGSSAQVSGRVRPGAPVAAGWSSNCHVVVSDSGSRRSRASSRAEAAPVASSTARRQECATSSGVWARRAAAATVSIAARSRLRWTTWRWRCSTVAAIATANTAVARVRNPSRSRCPCAGHRSATTVWRSTVRATTATHGRVTARRRRRGRGPARSGTVGTSPGDGLSPPLISIAIGLLRGASCPSTEFTRSGREKPGASGRGPAGSAVALATFRASPRVPVSGTPPPPPRRRPTGVDAARPSPPTRSAERPADAIGRRWRIGCRWEAAE